MSRNRFKSNVIFSYNYHEKILFLASSIFLAIILATAITVYILVLKDSDLTAVKAINSAAADLYNNIFQGTLIGSFYATLVGGLFFMFMPMELLFINFLRTGNNPYFLIGLYLAGFIISYTINYYIGFRLGGISKKIIIPKNFYKIKNVVNKYGPWAIFGFNVLPLPSQPLSAILGVFKYNKKKFYFYFILGELVKYSAISFGYFYII